MAFTMTVSNAITYTYLFATGKTEALAAGSTKYTKILAYLNIYTQSWAKERGVQWNSLRQDITIGTVTATDTFDLDSDIGKISKEPGDYVRIVHTDGENESDYTIVGINSLYSGGARTNSSGSSRGGYVGSCAVSGQSLVFDRAFKTTDAQYGGSIIVPSYTVPSTLTLASDTIVVDDPFWLCYMAAAEYVRTDLTRQSQYPNLIAQANDLMESMKANNDPQEDNVNTDTWSPLGATFS